MAVWSSRRGAPGLRVGTTADCASLHSRPTGRFPYNGSMEASPAEVEELQFGAQGLGSKFWTLIAATFLAFLGLGTVLPAMALHVRHDLGGTDQTVGFVIGTFSVVALAS